LEELGALQRHGVDPIACLIPLSGQNLRAQFMTTPAFPGIVQAVTNTTPGALDKVIPTPSPAVFFILLSVFIGG
jgi:hypothetical protein